MLTADQITSNDFVVAKPETTIGQAVAQMIDENASILMVLGADSQLVGTLSNSVVLRAAIDSQLRQSPVSLHMCRQFVSVAEHAPLDVVLDQFVLHDLDYLPVVNQGRLVGIITRIDLLRVAFGNSAHSAAGVVSV